MAKIHPKNIAEAIYNVTKGKSGGDLDQALKRSVQVLRDKHMQGKSEEILRSLQDIIEKEAGIIRVKITTAKKIENGERKKLENEIREKYKARIVMGEFLEKKELLGGIRIETGEEILDTTYKNKLNQLEKFLIQER